jgi:hypothetical protein
VDPYHLDQVLIIDRAVGFADIARAVERAGFTRDASAAPKHPSILPGEPELAGWTYGGAKPVVSYTFNPVVKLRVLEVATVPPVLRAAIAAGLKLLSAAEVEPLLRSADARERLRGLLVARETERVDLLPSLQKLPKDSEPAVAKAVNETTAALQRSLDARLAAHTHLQLLCKAVEELVPRLVADASRVRGLAPTAKDCAALFDASLAGEIAAAVALAWQTPPTINPGAGYPELEVTAAPAGLLRWPNELSQRFPLAYRDIAGWMTPSRTWVCWRHTSGSGRGVQFDGLAWVDDHWIWMPKVFRIVGPILEARLKRSAG